MRVVIAPDSFAGTLSATEAASAIAAGWTRVAPADELRLLPLADGGHGFVAVLHAALGGELRQAWVTGPLDAAKVRARWLRVERDGPAVGYLEAAQACGLHLVPPTRHGPTAAREATSRGVGELIVQAAATGLDEVVIGLGGSACTDGGSGALAALGVGPVDADGAALPGGGAALSRCAALCRRSLPAGVAPPPGAAGPGSALVADTGLPTRTALVLAADVDNPLLGRHGAATVFGPQKGADPGTVAALEAALGRWAEVLAAAAGRDPTELAAEAGGGAAGGLGVALLALGGRRVSGAGLVRRLTGLDAALDTADLVLTGEGSFDWQSLRGKLVASVAGSAAERGLPCVVLAGQVAVGRREAAAAGVAEAHSVAEHTGGVEAALADPARTLAELAADVASQWSGSH